MYKVQAAIDPVFDNKVMVKSWEFILKSRVEDNDTVNHVYYYNKSDIPDDFFKTSLGYYIEDGVLKRLGQS